VVDAGRIITAGGITSGMEMGFHLLRRAGYDETFIAEVARVMEYTQAYEIYRDDLEGWPLASRTDSQRSKRVDRGDKRATSIGSRVAVATDTGAASTRRATPRRARQ
jgi:hypothetical protein